MSKKSGVVERFDSRGKKVGRGSTVYSFKLDDGEWYRTGFDKPDMSEGDQVRFEYSDGQYGKEVDFSTLQVKKNPNGGSGTTGRGGSGTKGGGENWEARQAYWDNKDLRDIEMQKRIGYAGCLNSAIALMGNLLQADAFPVSKSKMSSKEGVAATQAVLVKIADEFWDLINNRPDQLGEQEVVEEVSGKDDLEQTAAEKVDDDDWGDDDWS